MACTTITSGFTLNCKGLVGGIKKIVLTDWENLNDPANDITFGTGVDEEVVTVLFITSPDLFTYEMDAQTGDFQEVYTFSRENMTGFYTQTVNVMLKGLAADKRLELEKVAKTRLVIFVEDANGNWWMVGLENGADLSTATAATGKVYGDGNGYTLAFTHDSPMRAYKCAGAPYDILD